MSYKQDWLELGLIGAELLEGRSGPERLEAINYDEALKEVWRDIVLIVELYGDDTGDHYYYNSKEYTRSHLDDLASKYSVPELEWLGSWYSMLGLISEDNTELSKVRKDELPDYATLLVYLSIRGPIPEEFPEDCSYAIVLEHMESIKRERARAEKLKRLSEYVKNFPEARKEMAEGEIPTSYAAELHPYNIRIDELFTYYNNSRKIPSLCGKHARRLIREYLETFGYLPSDASQCLNDLEVRSVEGLGAHMKHLRGTMNRELQARFARAYIREHPEEKEVSHAGRR